MFVAEAALLDGGNFDYHSCHPQDPSGKIAARWQSKGNLGIVLQEFRTLQSALPGQWEVRATINVGLKIKKKTLFGLFFFSSLDFTSLLFLGCDRQAHVHSGSLW